jgi:hypothetical protein
VYIQLAKPKLKIPEDSLLLDLLKVKSDDDHAWFFELAAMRIARHPAMPVDHISAAVLGRIDDSYIHEIAGRIFKYCATDNLLAGVEHNSFPAIISVIRKIIHEKTKIDETFNFHLVLPKLSRILDETRLPEDELFDYLDMWEHQIDEQIATSLVPILLKDYDIYPRVFQRKTGIGARLLKISLCYIEEFPAQDWERELQHIDGHAYQMLKFFVSAGILKKLPGAIQEAVSALIPKFTNTEYIGMYSQYDFFDLMYPLLDSTQLFMLAAHVRNHLLSDPEPSPAKLLFFEKILRDTKILEDNARDHAKLILARSSNDFSVLDRIIEHKEYYLSFLNKAGGGAYDVIQTIRNFIEHHDNNEATERYFEFLKAASLNCFGPVEIINAEYYSTRDRSLSRDVKAELKQRARTGYLYFFKLGNDISNDDDPDFGTPKQLGVEFKHKGISYNQEWTENQWIRLPY